MAKRPRMKPDTFAARHKAARLARGLSAADVATELGYTRMAVHHWESGKSPPRAETQGPLAKLLGVTAGWLMFGEGPNPLTAR